MILQAEDLTDELLDKLKYPVDIFAERDDRVINKLHRHELYFLIKGKSIYAVGTRSNIKYIRMFDGDGRLDRGRQERPNNDVSRSFNTIGEILKDRSFVGREYFVDHIDKETGVEVRKPYFNCFRHINYRCLWR